MAALITSPNGPPNLFDNGLLRDGSIAGDLGTERPNRILISHEATQIPLPHSPVEDLEAGDLLDIPVEDTTAASVDQAEEGFKSQARRRYPDVNGYDEYKIPDGVTEDILTTFPTLFRLLELYQEAGSGGLVEKVLIDQQSLRRFLETLLPGSYESVSRINFRALDKFSIKPLGIYGSKLEIVDFLLQTKCLSDDSAKILIAAIGSSNDLGSGLYLALPIERNSQGSEPEDAYIFFWPEDSTWEDSAISSVRRNRVTFIRYLSKLTDQMVALMSPGQVEAMVWTSGRRNVNDPNIVSEIFDESRMFSFEVEKSTEQEEDAIARNGFTVWLDVQKLSQLKEVSKISLVSGEENVGLLVEVSVPARTISKPYKRQVYREALTSMIGNTTRPITLGALTNEQLKILGDHGLRKSYPQPFAQHGQRMSCEEADRNSEYKKSMSMMKERIQQDKPQLKSLIKLQVQRHFSTVYPSLEIDVSVPESESRNYESLHEKYPGLAGVPAGIEATSSASTINDSEFKDLKYAWHTIRDYLNQEPTPPINQQVEFVKEILGDTSGGEWTIVAKSKRNKRGIKSTIIESVKAFARLIGYEPKSPAQCLPDPEFVRSLPGLVDAFPVVSELTNRISTCLQANLAKLGNKLAGKHLKMLVKEEESRLEAIIERTRWDRSQTESEKAGLTLLHNLRSLMPPNPSSVLSVDFVAEMPPSHGNRAQQFCVRGTEIDEHQPRKLFAIYPLELTEYDTQQCQSNEQHDPKPQLSNKPYFTFTLPEGDEIKFIHLIQDKCLVVVAGPGQFDLYLDDTVRLRDAIEGRPKRSLKYDRMVDPSQCVFAFDQKTRLLAVFYNTNINGPELSLFGFDESFSHIRARGSPFPLKEWYETEVQIEKICFVSGSEEICLIEPSGRARVLSLVTVNFRPASVQIPGRVVDAFSAPDGSCLLISVAREAKSESSSEHKLLVYHWASFGSTQSGISPALLPSSDACRVVTSFKGRNRVHLVSFSNSTMTATSVALSIKQKTTEFSFRSNQPDSTDPSAETTNNCLIDCHRDVWTRFPVAPAVTRSILSSMGREPRKLVFASTSNLELINNYFSRLITKLERTTCKPIGAELKSLSVVATSDPPDVLIQNIQRSKYLLGSFVVEFLCLIPLQLAITRDNRFIPLKDGIWDLEYERSLLGADVPSIINSLSIGWYESLFQSYMATKPVRVVSSMGEQSVGKSYCLNHFADTSFAGSAMRTTEGVWLSCTPTDEYLLVSLDFEGVHSIERSAQEDALLVLFNTAISNLVLFRNNFALSRDIAGLFQSFQSSAMVLDPESNPGLFNSTLAIIIKDVTDSDAKDIVKEFSLKFQRIVQNEQEQNFISRLHRGRVQIIPWPVINSPSFYTLFHHLRRYLDTQPITHSSGGVFLHNMKTLMAKIKASDWGSLDQNLATHRAQQLEKGLRNALSRGSSDEGVIQTPLKNLDTDEDISTEESSTVFFVPAISGISTQDEAEIENALDALVGSCLAGSTIGPRHIIGDRDYIELLQEQLDGLLHLRLEHVRRWLQVNVQRFPASSQDIRNIYSKIETMAHTMHTTVQLCTEPCSSCHYRCTRSYRHSGAHGCGTTHRCLFPCGVSKDHPDPVPCGLPAGHGAQHMCDIKAHSCGQDCHLNNKNGQCIMMANIYARQDCTHVVNRVVCVTLVRGIAALEPVKQHGMNHIHATGAASRLRAPSNVNSVSAHVASLITSTDWIPKLHTSVAKNITVQALALRGGFAGLIETHPSAVERLFSGRHEKFQYTRYTQVEQRLTCVIPIPPGELQHAGEHSHTTDEKAFHYCNVRCPSCQYLCTLPLGHPQQLHETSHGSMTNTEWAIQGTNLDARYELDGRNFGIGDEGAPMLCHLVCSAQGRHAHIEFCREPDASSCQGTAELEHIRERMLPDPHLPKDWISHRLKWARSGFQGSYTQRSGKLNDALTRYGPYRSVFSRTAGGIRQMIPSSGPEHNDAATAGANPSYCNLPIFHSPQARHAAPTNGYISADGHRFECANPARLHQAYHVIFVIDSSGSMGSGDRTPLSNTPVSQLLRTRCNNRYGAVLSALHGFWLSREAGQATAQPRQDAYSVITFNEYPTTRLANDFTSTTNQLLSQLLQTSAGGGTNFNSALAQAQILIRTHWNSDKAPVLVFLSDGQCSLNRNTVYDLCRSGTYYQLKTSKPLAFYSVSFGPDRSSAPLREMVQIAAEVYASAPRNALGNIQGDPCAYHNAVDSIQLADTFLGIANSLHKPRASLIGQSSGRRAL
ncbi:unnamed protein product [Rhizoctonia solani]|uniref:VWFA domain-containing protein n=1 Tax=Rhizoctonia solani TaxID=456999 RepID=A0A8H3I043_9AGAM|nr:unnamed protein product [Rhizoctonia solani]